MLVTRQCEIGRNTWSSSKLEAIYQSAASPRMSNFDPLPAQPEWREQYSTFPLPGESSLLPPSFGQPTSSNATNTAQEPSQTAARPQSEHGLETSKPASQLPPPIERREAAAGGQPNGSARDDSLVSTESTALSLRSNPVSSTTSLSTQQGTVVNKEGPATEGEVKDDDEDIEDDDEMLEVEPEEGAPPQTAAERRAERRKMKRFR